jgi:8-oxo-dGTP pyrophosphatase MutT (NUDIX family)
MNLRSKVADEGTGTMSITIPTLLADGIEPVKSLALAIADAPMVEDALAEQVGALCWRLHKGRVQVLLVTSRDTGRWVLPKGWPMAGKAAEAAAAREAWEEAGVEGLVQAQSIGRYCYDKIRPNALPLLCCVDVFPLRVRRLKSDFPEQKQRRRKWFSAAEAASLVAEAELAVLLGQLHEAPELLTAAPLLDKARQPAS